MKQSRWKAFFISGLGSIFFLALPVAVHGTETVTVFAAASLAQAITDLADVFTAKGGGKVTPSFAGSSILAKQIENGAPANLFISADEDWMNYLADRQLIVPPSRLDLLGNRLVLIALRESPIRGEIGPGFPLAQLLGDSRLATADPDHVPAGKYAKAALGKLGVWTGIESKLARADNVRAALALVERGECALGIVYATDAAISMKVRIVGAFPEDTHPPIVYPVALVSGKDTPASRSFLDFLKTPEARSVFEKYGFTVR